MKRGLAVLSLVAGLTVSGCGGESSRNPAAPSSAALPQVLEIDSQAGCPSLNGDPGCFSPPPGTQGLNAPDVATLLPPLNLQATVSGTSVKLQWVKQSGSTPTSYQIQAGTTSGGLDRANFNTGSTSTTFNGTNLVPGPYYVRVRERDPSGVGPASNEVKFTIAGSTGGACTSVPNPPRSLTVTVSGSSLIMHWLAPAFGCPVGTYIMQSGTAPGLSNVANLVTGSTSTSLTVSGVAAGTYYIRIRARNTNGVSGPSNEVQVTVTGGGTKLSVTRFVCFGDSMTDGGLDPYLSSGGYPTRLLALLRNRYPSQTFQVINEALGGERAYTHGRDRLPGVLSLWNPQVLCLLEGGNDLNRTDIGPPAITNLPLSAISTMVQTARNRGIAVMLASLPPQRPGGSKAGGVPYLSTYNSGIQQIAGNQGATFVNVFAALNANLALYIGPDGFHPTVAGHNKIADTFFSAIVNRFQTGSPDTLTDSQTGWQLEDDGMPSPDQP